MAFSKLSFLQWFSCALTVSSFTPFVPKLRNDFQHTATELSRSSLMMAKAESAVEEAGEVVAEVADKAADKVADAVKGDSNEFLSKVSGLFESAPKATQYDVMIKLIFPGALNYEQLEARIKKKLATKDYRSDNTLLATSLCCDELARTLEKDLAKVYGTNFNLGGLAGFPFAGNTGFGAMAGHIPDDGSVLIVYAPHVGVATSGGVGKVERRGIDLVDNCCGSAIAASNYVKSITDGAMPINIGIQEFTDFQQQAVQELILPHGKRLQDADDRMRELPFALYDSQDNLMREIVKKGAPNVKNHIALLGGIQINTAPEALDYFLPLRFDLMNNKGEVVENMLDDITYN